MCSPALIRASLSRVKGRVLHNQTFTHLFLKATENLPAKPVVGAVGAAGAQQNDILVFQSPHTQGHDMGCYLRSCCHGPVIIIFRNPLVHSATNIQKTHFSHLHTTSTEHVVIG